jgi:hypothetical protein
MLPDARVSSVKAIALAAVIRRATAMVKAAT